MKTSLDAGMMANGAVLLENILTFTGTVLNLLGWLLQALELLGSSGSWHSWLAVAGCLLVVPQVFSYFLPKLFLASFIMVYGALRFGLGVRSQKVADATRPVVVQHNTYLGATMSPASPCQGQGFSASKSMSWIAVAGILYVTTMVFPLSMVFPLCYFLAKALVPVFIILAVALVVVGLAATIWSQRPHRFTAYHGTTMAAARLIQRHGFKASTVGCLGAGVYVVEERDINKAKRFAHDQARRAGDEPALITVTVTVWNPKVVPSNGTWNDDGWQAEGHDACSVTHTNISPRPEWCIRDPCQVQVKAVNSLLGEERPTN
mmetsp:Transcript_15339/g.34838  ORF Transcript_15339/g.34838 Transcript_15339/m.34838 type:complete len:319 (-) Transcript_15339:65-1021(-)